MRTIDVKDTVNNTIQTRRELVEGSGKFDVVMSAPPANRVPANFGQQHLLKWILEPPKQVGWAQWGTKKYFSPKYRFSCDFNPNWTLQQLRDVGFSAFGWSITDAEKSQLQNEMLYYLTENTIEGPLEGVGVYHASIQEYFNQVFAGIPVLDGRHKYLAFNIENSNEWWPGNRGSTFPGFAFEGSYGTAHSGSWDSLKGKSIFCESDGVTRTVDQLAALGPDKWASEFVVRRANRLVVAMQIARYRADPFGVLVAYGASMMQQAPQYNAGPTYIYGTDVFNDGQADGSKLPGITSDGRYNFGPLTLTLKGNQYWYETFHLDYDYPNSFNILETDLDEIWNGSDNNKKTHSYVAGKIQPIHSGAYMKSRWQALVYRMKNIPGQKLRPIMHMIELHYEGDKAIVVDGSGNYIRDAGSFRAPNPQLQGVAGHQNNTGGIAYYDTPKVWISPGEMYSRKVWHRFLCADLDGSGSHIFESRSRFDPNNPDDPATKVYNHELHTATALVQARHALQAHEQLFEKPNVLVEDPEVRLDGQTTWAAYNGAKAFGLSGGGVKQPQLPAYSLRYWDQGDSWLVTVIGQHRQATGTTTRTDTLRIPSNGVNGNMFRVTLRGHFAKISQFVVPKSSSGQTFDELGQNTNEKAGYAGEIQ